MPEFVKRPDSQFCGQAPAVGRAIESGDRFEIQIAGKRINMPVRTMFLVEYEKSEDAQEIEFQISWERNVAYFISNVSVAQFVS